MTIHTNVGGVWKEQSSVGTIKTNVGGVWKDVADVHVNVAGVWKKVFPSASDPLPLGIIVFSNSPSIPIGWGRFYNADGRFIIGANGATGYMSNVEIDAYFGSAGEHSHSSWSGRQRPLYPGPAMYQSRDTFAEHTGAQSGLHTHLVRLNYKPEDRTLILIKSTGVNSKLPINSIVLGSQAFGGMTNIYNSEANFLRAGEISTSSALWSSSSQNAGNHIHQEPSYPTDWRNWKSWNWPTPWDDVNRDSWQGDHSLDPGQPTSSSVSLRKVLLSLWSSASAEIDLQANMIAMWEDITAPSGWKLCDGINGTPDLRDCFIRTAANGSEVITPSGTNTASISYSGVSHQENHSHHNNIGPIAVDPVESYTGDNWVYNNHYHAGPTITNASLRPTSYALSFIMKS